MKVIPFKIPRPVHASIRVQVDERPHLYNHLHQHPEIQLTLIEQSKGTLIAGDYVGRFTEGDVIVIGANQPHVFRNDDHYFTSRCKAKAISIFFDDTTMGEGFWQLPEAKQGAAFLRTSAGGYRVTGKKKTMITHLLRSITTAEGFQRMILFMEILRLLAHKKEMHGLSTMVIQKPIRNFDGTRLNKVLTYTFQESEQPIHLSTIARVANMTAAAFCKYFKTRTGKTYVHFLQEIRINNACRTLLASPDMAIATIAYTTGFNNLSHFNRVFKRIMGTTPQTYRDQVNSPSRS